MIEVHNLTKYYGTRLAIEGLNFRAEKGEIVGFLGPNGAGKTTTMRILTTYLVPSQGTARVAGYDVLEQPLEVRRRIGYLPERIALYEDMRVREYLLFMGRLRRVPRLRQRVDEVLERVQLLDRAESFIGTLSQGMRQRVGLAQAILHDPEVLILDEPTLGLDPAQQVEVRKLIMELGKERTVLLSTHILPEVQQVCRRVIILHKGRIVAEDTTQALSEQLEGIRRIFVQVAGRETLQPLQEQLAALPGVLAVESSEDHRLEVKTRLDVDLRPQVARTVLEAGYDLLELRTATLSLEDIFLQLVRDENEHPPEAEASFQEPITAETATSEEAR